MGDQHIEIIMERMKRKFGVEADLRAPIVEYRETIRGTAMNVEGKHKKQSGGHGQYGHVIINMEPLPPGTGFEFVDKIFGGAVPRQYIPAVEKGLRWLTVLTTPLTPPKWRLRLLPTSPLKRQWKLRALY